MWRTFRKYAGTYFERRKFPTAPDADLPRVVIEVNQNLLTVHFEGLPRGRTITGQIVMNPQFPLSGQGHYDDRKAGEQLWGFWHVQIKDENTLLVHTTYASMHDTAVVQGYIWRRSPQA